MLFNFEGKTYETAEDTDAAKLPDGRYVKIHNGSAALVKKAPPGAILASEFKVDPPAPDAEESASPAPAADAPRPLEGVSKADLLREYADKTAAIQAAEESLKGIRSEIGFRLATAGKGAFWTLPNGAHLTGKRDRSGAYTTAEKVAGHEAG